MRISELFDRIIADNNLRNDAGLAERLEIEPGNLSRMRNHRESIGAVMILRIHESFDIPIATIKTALGMKSLARIAP